MEDKEINCFKENIEIPEIVRLKADNAFSQIRKENDMKNNNRRYLHFFKSQAAAAFAIVIAGAGITAVAAGVNLWSDGALDHLSATPEQQQELTDKGIAMTSENKDLSKLAVTDNGITIKPDTVIVDDRSAHVSFKITGSTYHDGMAFDSNDAYIENGDHLQLNTGFKRGSKGSDKYLEYSVLLLPSEDEDLVGKAIHIDLKNIGFFDKDGDFNSTVNGKWGFTIKLPDVSADRAITVNKKIEDSVFEVDTVHISPISIKVEYSIPENLEKKTGTDAPTLAGIRMKDGTEYSYEILGAGQCGNTSDNGKKSEDSFSFEKVIDADNVAAILVNSTNGKAVEVPIE